MNDCMTFPDTVEEFMEQYKVVDTEHIYTNGSEFVPIFRMKQWFDHLPSVQPDTTTHDSIPAETGENDGVGTSGDCISRQQSIDALRKMQTYKLFAGDDMLLIDQAEAQTELMMLPSAEPEREKGEWVYNSPVTMKCNRCGLVIKDWDWHRFKICQNCGADMRGGENDGCSQVFEREESDV